MAHNANLQSSKDTEGSSGSSLANGGLRSMQKETLSKPYNDWPNDLGVLPP